jgi:hypothetical protein
MRPVRLAHDRQSCRVIPAPASTPRAPTGLSELLYATTVSLSPAYSGEISQSSPRGKRIPAQGATLGIQNRHNHRVLKERPRDWSY